MRQVINIFLFDGVSKVFLALVTFGLVRYLSVDEYSRYTYAFTTVLLGFQCVCGVVERLYIADHDNYRIKAEGLVPFLSIVVMLLCGLYLYGRVDARLLLAAVAVQFTCVVFQTKRITVQRESKFNRYMILDLLRNVLWLVLVVGGYFVYELTALWALAAYGASAIAVMLLVPTKNEPLQLFSTNVRSFVSAWNYLQSRRYLVAYCILASAAPYFALLLVSQMGDTYLIATYGAALRYQAIFAMFVFALNSVLVVKYSHAGESAHLQVMAFYKVLPVILVVMCILAAAIWFFIPLIDSGKYALLPNAFLLMAACSVVTLISTPAVNHILASADYKRMLSGLVLGMAVMALSSLILVNFTRSYGVLLGTLLGYLIIAICNIFASARLARATVNY